MELLIPSSCGALGHSDFWSRKVMPLIMNDRRLILSGQDLSWSRLNVEVCDSVPTQLNAEQ